MQFVGAVLPEALPLRALLLLGLTVLACLLFAEAFERPLPELRRSIRGVLATLGGREVAIAPPSTRAAD
jgi:hypothetical protein